MAHIGSRKLTIDIDGEEVAPDVSAATIASEETDSDFVSFAAAAAGGGRTYKLGLTIAQDAAAGSLWSQVWDAAGSEVDVIVRPYGNAVASIAEPHFEGTVVITEPDGELLGGEADPSTTQVFTIEVEWTFTAKPTRVTTV
jgi:hypothetical protein